MTIKKITEIAKQINQPKLVCGMNLSFIKPPKKKTPRLYGAEFLISLLVYAKIFLQLPDAVFKSDGRLPAKNLFGL